MRPERLDLGTERLDLRPERLDLRPEGPDEGGGTDARTNERTNESPPVFYRTSSPSGPLPKKGRKGGGKKEKKEGNTERKEPYTDPNRREQ